MSQNTNLLSPATRDALSEDYVFMWTEQLPKAFADANLDHIAEVIEQIEECEDVLFLDLAARFYLV